ncbi:acetylcholine-gated cation-selective channel [Aureococcus anophagefferens]|nr:acetylcholine-gated cation-selective channel [Aureococcus anophagefferens]
MALEQATRHIEQAVKEVEAATSAESRLAASKKCYRAVWELRGALRDVHALGPLRENSAQAKAWDALEALLGARGLVVSEALRFGAREAVVALYGAGDAGGQLYAAARGLHELCGECSTSVLPVAAKKTQNRSVGSRAASRLAPLRRTATVWARDARRGAPVGGGADDGDKAKGGDAAAGSPRPEGSTRMARLRQSVQGGSPAAAADAPKKRSAFGAALCGSDRGGTRVIRRRFNVGSDGAGPSLVGAVGFLAALVARHRRDRSRRGVAGAARAVGALLEREAGARARRELAAVLRATLAPLRDDARASQDDDDAAAAARCALGRELRKRLGAARSSSSAARRRCSGSSGRRAAATTRRPHLATALGDAAAPCGDGLERAALSFSSDASFGVRAEAAAVGGALGGALRPRLAPLATMALKAAMAEHHALVDLAVAGDQAGGKKRQGVSVRMCALHGAATLAATLLRSFDAGAAGPSRALVDEALAVAEGLVMRQFDASLCAANRAAVLRAHGRFRLKLVAAGLLEAYAALPPAAFEGDPRAAGRVFDWAVGLVLVAGAVARDAASDAEAAFAPLPNESLALTSEFPPGIDPASSSATRRPARASATARTEREALAFLDVERGCPAARVDARLVDAAKNAGRARGARRASGCGAIDALSRALTHALTPPKSGLMSSEEDRRRRERRHATAAANACAALLAILDALPRTFARVADATADPFGPARTVSTSPLSDAPRDALAKALAAASPLCRRAAASAMAKLVCRLEEPKAKLAAAKALADACGKADAPRSEPDAARRGGGGGRAGRRPGPRDARRRGGAGGAAGAFEARARRARGGRGGAGLEALADARPDASSGDAGAVPWLLLADACHQRGAARRAASVVRAACEAFGDAAWLPPAPEVRPEAGGDEAEEDEAKAPRRGAARAEARREPGPGAPGPRRVRPGSRGGARRAPGRGRGPDAPDDAALLQQYASQLSAAAARFRAARPTPNVAARACVERMAEAGLLADAAAWKRLLRVAASTPSLAKPDDTRPRSRRAATTALPTTSRTTSRGSASSPPRPCAARPGPPCPTSAASAGAGSPSPRTARASSPRSAGGPYDADAFAGAYFDVGAGACYDGRADAAGVRRALVDALPACCAAAAPRRGAGDDAAATTLLGVALACAVDGDGGGAVAALLAHSSTLGAGAVAAAFGAQRASDGGAAGVARSSSPPFQRAGARAPLAGLVSTALAPLLAADAGGVAELLVKLAKGNVDLFRGAVAALAPADVARVQAAMGKAIKRAAAPPTRLAPPPRASPGGGGLKLNMSQYR